jgi:hypothetical protein
VLVLLLEEEEEEEVDTACLALLNALLLQLQRVVYQLHQHPQ